MCGRDRLHPEWRVRRTKFHSGQTPVDTGPTRDAAHCWPTMVCASHSVDTETRNSGATSFWTSKWMSSPRVSKLPRFPAKTFSLSVSLTRRSFCQTDSRLKSIVVTVNWAAPSLFLFTLRVIELERILVYTGHAQESI